MKILLSFLVVLTIVSILLSVQSAAASAGPGMDANPVTLNTLGKSFWFIPSVMYEIETMPSFAVKAGGPRVSAGLSGRAERFSLGVTTSIHADYQRLMPGVGVSFDRMLQTVNYRYIDTIWWGWYDDPILFDGLASTQSILPPLYSGGQRERHSIGRVHSRYSLMTGFDVAF